MKNTLLKFLKFGIVGASGVVVNQGVLMLLRVLFPELPVEVRSPIAIELAIISNFILNFHWTWGDTKAEERKVVTGQFMTFNLSSGLTALFCNYLPLLFMVNVLAWNEDLSNLIGIAFASGLNFLISHFWTFKRKNQ